LKNPGAVVILFLFLLLFLKKSRKRTRKRRPLEFSNTLLLFALKIPSAASRSEMYVDVCGAFSFVSQET
jgi:NADH:ubiquinone oxidoreductase subunit 6 (subunit J)